MNPKVSIILLNYNGLRNLGQPVFVKCLSSVLKSTYSDFEVIFADNASTDGSVQFVKDEFGWANNLKFVSNQANYGFALGNNLALKHANGTYVILLNNDVEVEPNWIQELVNVLEVDSSIAIAQSKILSFDHTTIQSVGNLFDPSFMVYCIGANQADVGQYNQICDITFACGAALIIRSSIIQQIGLFDPAYFWFHDDSDLCWRARLAGFRVVSVPSSIVYHKGSATSTRAFKERQDIFYYLTSQIGLLIKNTELKNFLKHGLKVFTGISSYIVAFLIQGNVKIPARVCIWSFKTFRHNWNWHIKVKKLRKINDEELLNSFLDSSLFVLRLRRILYKLTGRNKYGEKLELYANQATLDYYSNHLYEPTSTR